MAIPVAFITGASRGIGKQLAIDFAKQGYDIIALARSTADAPTKLPGTVDETADLVRAEGRRCLPIGCNLSSEADIQAAIDTTLKEFDRLDVLINNAGIAPPGATVGAPWRRWKLAVDINLNAPLYLSAGLAPRIADSGGGHIINISSGAAFMPEFGRVSYTATKRGLEGMSEALAAELKPHQVAINVVRLELSVWSEGYEFTLGDVDTSGFEDPVIMSDACLWLAHQPPDYTGQILTIADLRTMGAVRPQTRIADRKR